MTGRTDFAALRTRQIDQQMRKPRSAWPETPVIFLIGLFALGYLYFTAGGPL